MNEKQKEKLINDHWSYVWRLLIHHHIDWAERHIAEHEYRRGFSDGWDGKPKDPIMVGIADFHYLTAYEHASKHKSEKT